MKDKGHRATNSEAWRIAADVRLALEQLEAACAHARQVVVEARSLLETCDEPPSVYRIDPAFASGVSKTDVDSNAKPQWDSQTRTLSVDGIVVKQYRVPSRNQEAVLAAFQEEGWPRRIDDPLPAKLGMKAKYRLHFTIGRLNRSERQPKIHFFGDGTGEGVCWEFSSAAVVSFPRAIGNRQGMRRAA